METRVYKDKINLKKDDVKQFWEKRAEKVSGIKSVLFGDDKNVQIQRNKKECMVLVEAIKKYGKSDRLNILDIGCGVGRWVDNLYSKIETYIGVDFTNEYIKYATEQYGSENIQFYEMSAYDLSDVILNKKYNMVICSGVLMYVNDNKIANIFNNIKKVATDLIYIQESVSLMSNRLTLNNFKSTELKSDYSAIYRTRQEYENYFKNFKILDTNLLLDDKIGGRKETNARYWILKG